MCADREPSVRQRFSRRASSRPGLEGIDKVRASEGSHALAGMEMRDSPAVPV